MGGPSVTHPVDETLKKGMLREESSDPPARRCWMAVFDGELVGHAQLALDWRNGNARLSRIAIAPSARKRGLAAPQLALVIEQAFRATEMERVELNVYSFNAPALRCYERAGFKIKGVRRSSARVGDERWDTVTMAILRAEWLAMAGSSDQ